MLNQHVWIVIHWRADGDSIVSLHADRGGAVAAAIAYRIDNKVQDDEWDDVRVSQFEIN